MSGLVVAVFVGALVLAGCGGGGSKANASGTSSTSTTAAGNADFQKYRDCLKQHGVDLPAGVGNGTGGRRQGQGAPGDTTDTTAAGGSTSSSVPRTRPSLPPGVDQQTFQAAQQACDSLRPAGGGGFGGGQGAGRNSAEFRAYVSCLSDHGVPVSTTTSTTAGSTPPSTTPGGGQRGPGQQFDRNDPHFASANQVCMALLPQPSTTTTTAAKS